MEQVLYYIHYALLLMFGVTVSAAVSGVNPTRWNLIRLLILTALCGTLQLAVYGLFGEQTVWQLYPLITHLPIVLTLKLFFGKQMSHAAVATATAYLYCQPAKWLGLAAFSFSGSPLMELLVRIAVLLATFVVILRWFAEKIAKIYSPVHKTSWVFGITPVVYYLFDYAVAIYSSLWADSHRLVVEFLPLFLCLGHLLFCAIYHREYELKQDAERKEQILRITAEQQAKEMEMIRRSEEEIRRLRHDLKLFLNSLSSCVEESDKETARKLISVFSQQAEASTVKRYCANDTLNYVLSDYAAQCREKGVRFHAVVELTELAPDEILFSTILANALENALNAQSGQSKEKGAQGGDIRLLLKDSSGKTLLCVKNTFHEAPLFHNGIPASFREGHGYGVQSILYITEKLGGNCQFTLEEDWFVLRVIV